MWTLQDNRACLTQSPLVGTIVPTRPDAGLHELRYADKEIACASFLLHARNPAEPLQQLQAESPECFVRDRDLVIQYPETSHQNFSAELYWRAWKYSADNAGVDLHISLQTTLLECFPLLECRSLLPSGQVVAFDGTGVTEIIAECSGNQPVHGSHDFYCALLLRPQDSAWSYLEAIHPSDNKGWQWETTPEQRGCVSRAIGGDFQEKGVIRRFRLRAGIVSRESDLELAREIVQRFVDEPLPLTA